MCYPSSQLHASPPHISILRSCMPNPAVSLLVLLSHSFGRLSLSRDGLLQRNNLVYSAVLR